MSRDSKADVALLLDRISQITKESEEKRFKELKIERPYRPSSPLQILAVENLTPEILRSLITDDELAETVKTLQRALDRLDASQVENDASHVHQKFLQSGLDMCIRKSNNSVFQEAVPDCRSRLPLVRFSPNARDSPSFSSRRTGTITTLEIEHIEIIESGFYSVVCKFSFDRCLRSEEVDTSELTRHSVSGKARWRDQVVAIKEMAKGTDKELFLNEVKIWHKLRYQHVLREFSTSSFLAFCSHRLIPPLFDLAAFLGASSTTSMAPYFIVSPFQEKGNILRYLSHHPQESRLRLVRCFSPLPSLAYPSLRKEGP